MKFRFMNARIKTWNFFLKKFHTIHRRPVNNGVIEYRNVFTMRWKTKRLETESVFRIVREHTQRVTVVEPRALVVNRGNRGKKNYSTATSAVSGHTRSRRRPRTVSPRQTYSWRGRFTYYRVRSTETRGLANWIARRSIWKYYVVRIKRPKINTRFRNKSNRRSRSVTEIRVRMN